MALIVATWPDNSVSVLRAPSDWSAIWLFDELDQEGNPLDAKVCVVKGRHAHIGWFPGATQDAAEERLEPYAFDGDLKPWEWPSDILDQWVELTRNRPSLAQ